MSNTSAAAINYCAEGNLLLCNLIVFISDQHDEL